MDYQAKPYVVVDRRRSRNYPAPKPWMARLPDELPHEHARRLNHTCYHCGQYEGDLKVLDQHERAHTDRG